MSSDSEDYSDEDYNPDKDVSPAGSEIESDDEVDEEAADDSENEKGVSAGKRKKKIAPGSARKKAKQPEVKETEDDPDDEEAEKKRADALWADFLGDEAPVEKEKPRKEMSKVTETRTRKIESPAKPQEEIKEPVVIKEIFEFAGEQVVVEKEVKVAAAAPESSASSKRGFPVARSGGLGSVLGALNKKNKISTLEKSKLDWDRFKKDEGIADDLKNYNRDGYLERQDFLERTDLRQFEIEKSIKKKK